MRDLHTERAARDSTSRPEAKLANYRDWYGITGSPTGRAPNDPEMQTLHKRLARPVDGTVVIAGIDFSEIEARYMAHNPREHMDTHNEQPAENIRGDVFAQIADALGIATDEARHRTLDALVKYTGSSSHGIGPAHAARRLRAIARTPAGEICDYARALSIVEANVAAGKRVTAEDWQAERDVERQTGVFAGGEMTAGNIAASSIRSESIRAGATIASKLSDTTGLTKLGSEGTTYEYAGADAKLLERFANPMKRSERRVPLDTGRKLATVEIVAPEFTSLCPLTGQPDFATIVVEYEPRDWCVESKAFKLYLGSFRQTGEFHEACVERIANDLRKLLEPAWLRVVGQFTPRGGIKFWPTVEYDDREPAFRVSTFVDTELDTRAATAALFDTRDETMLTPARAFELGIVSAAMRDGLIAANVVGLPRSAFEPSIGVELGSTAEPAHTTNVSVNVDGKRLLSDIEYSSLRAAYYALKTLNSGGKVDTAEVDKIIAEIGNIKLG